MYDLAKRSLAFTVATGGLLLTGTAFSPAMAAAGLVVKEAGGVNAPSAPGSGTASDGTAGKSLRGQAAQPPDVHSRPLSAPDPDAALARDVLHIPIDLGFDLCGSSTAQASALRDWLDGGCAAAAASGAAAHSGSLASAAVEHPLQTVPQVCGDAAQPAPLDAADPAERRSTCATAEGSAPTRPGVSAGIGGASATAVSSGQGAADAAYPAMTPIEVPLAACGAGDDTTAERAVRTGAPCTDPAPSDGAAQSDGTAQNDAIARNDGPVQNDAMAQSDGSAQSDAVQNDAMAQSDGSAQSHAIRSDAIARNDGAAQSDALAQADQAAQSTKTIRIAERAAPLPDSRRDRGADVPLHTPVAVCEEATGAAAVDVEGDGSADSDCTPCPPTPCPPPPTCPPTPPPPPPSTCPPSTPPPGRTGPPPSSPPPTTPPPTTPITGHSLPVSSPPPSESSTPPAVPSPSMSTRPHGPGKPPGLAHTGADVEIALGVAGAALLTGLGLRLAARRREQD